MSRTRRLVISTVPYLGLVSSGALVLMMAGCGSDSPTESEGPSGPAAVASVTVSRESVTLPIGTTQQLTATVKDAAGNELSDRTVTWSSSATTIVTVDATGLVALVTGVAAGSVTITATSEGKSGTAAVEVEAVASVTISPPTVLLMGGNTVQLTATVRNAEGFVLSGYPVTWTSTNTDCVIVDTTGLATMFGPPGASVIATAEIDGVSVMGRAEIWP